MDPVSSIQTAHASQAAASFSTIMVGTGIVVVGSVMMSVGIMADSVLRRFGAKRRSGKGHVLPTSTEGQETGLS